MTTTNTAPSMKQTRTTSPTRLKWRAGVAVAAVLAALVTWLVANLLIDSGVRVNTQDSVTTIGASQVLMTSALAALAGWALLAALERFTGSARRIWTVIAVIVLVLSCIGPLSSGIDAASKAALVTLHIVTGAVLIAGLRRSTT